MVLKNILMSEKLFVVMYKKLIGILLIVTLVICSGIIYNKTVPNQVTFNSKVISF